MEPTQSSAGSVPRARLRLPRFVLLAPVCFSVVAALAIADDDIFQAILMGLAAVAGLADYLAKSIVVTPTAIVTQSYRRVEAFDPAAFVSVERRSFFKHRVILRDSEQWAPFSYPSLTERISQAISETSPRHV